MESSLIAVCQFPIEPEESMIAICCQSLTTAVTVAVLPVIVSFENDKIDAPAALVMVHSTLTPQPERLPLRIFDCHWKNLVAVFRSELINVGEATAPRVILFRASINVILNRESNTPGDSQFVAVFATTGISENCSSAICELVATFELGVHPVVEQNELLVGEVARGENSAKCAFSKSEIEVPIESAADTDFDDAFPKYW